MLSLELLRFRKISLCAAVGFFYFGGHLYMMLKNNPIESAGRKSKLREVQHFFIYVGVINYCLGTIHYSDLHSLFHWTKHFVRDTHVWRKFIGESYQCCTVSTSNLLKITIDIRKVLFCVRNFACFYRIVRFTEITTPENSAYVSKQELGGGGSKSKRGIRLYFDAALDIPISMQKLMRHC